MYSYRAFRGMLISIVEVRHSVTNVQLQSVPRNVDVDYLGRRSITGGSPMYSYRVFREMLTSIVEESVPSPEGHQASRAMTVASG